MDVDHVWFDINLTNSSQEEAKGHGLLGKQVRWHVGMKTVEGIMRIPATTRIKRKRGRRRRSRNALSPDI